MKAPNPFMIVFLLLMLFVVPLYCQDSTTINSSNKTIEIPRIDLTNQNSIEIDSTYNPSEIGPSGHLPADFFVELYAEEIDLTGQTLLIKSFPPLPETRDSADRKYKIFYGMQKIKPAKLDREYSYIVGSTNRSLSKFNDMLQKEMSSCVFPYLIISESDLDKYSQENYRYVISSKVVFMIRTTHIDDIDGPGGKYSGGIRRKIYFNYQYCIHDRVTGRDYPKIKLYRRPNILGMKIATNALVERVLNEL